MFKNLLWAPSSRGAYFQYVESRPYAGCPQKPPHGKCPCPPANETKCETVKVSTAKPGKIECPRPTPANPCYPVLPTANYKKYKRIFFFICIPIIIIQGLRVLYSDEGHVHKLICREYEYMRRRTKRFPWGDGVKSLFHNDHVNSLPEECTIQPQPQDCK